MWESPTPAVSRAASVRLRCEQDLLPVSLRASLGAGLPWADVHEAGDGVASTGKAAPGKVVFGVFFCMSHFFSKNPDTVQSPFRSSLVTFLPFLHGRMPL